MSSKAPPAQPPVLGKPLLVSHPQPPVDPLHRPFVGNETIDDNLRESVKVAVWNVMGDRERGLAIDVAAGVATLAGAVADRAEAAAVRKAALSIAGIAEIVDHLMPAANMRTSRKSAAASVPVAAAAEVSKFVALTRFCGLDDASTGAAIRQAVGRLDHFFAERKLPSPERLVIVYRNLIPGAITLELGFPVSAHGEPRTEGEFNVTDLPPSIEQVAVTTPGIGPIIATLRDLMQAGHPFAWQVLVGDEFRPWRGHPALPLNVARGT